MRISPFGTSRPSTVCWAIAEPISPNNNTTTALKNVLFERALAEDRKESVTKVIAKGVERQRQHKSGIIIISNFSIPFVFNVPVARQLNSIATSTIAGNAEYSDYAGRVRRNGCLFRRQYYKVTQRLIYTVGRAFEDLIKQRNPSAAIDCFSVRVGIENQIVFLFLPHDVLDDRSVAARAHNGEHFIPIAAVCLQLLDQL
jgi:hypothetical protein